MNNADDEEGFDRRHIAQEILCLRARDVIRLGKVKDPLSLRMNMKDALRNWKDVADLLGYSAEMILGLFAHDARPGLVLLEDWMYKKNGILGRLVDVFTKLEMYNCLEVIYECVVEYEETSVNRVNEPREDDDDIQPQSLTSESSVTTGSHTTDFSTEQESSISTMSSLPPSVSCIEAPCTSSGSFSSEVGNLSSVEADCNRESTGNCLGCHNLNNDNTEHEASTMQKPDLFRLKSWSPPGLHGTLTDHVQPVDGGRNLYIRSASHPADIMKSKVGAENKKKSKSIKKTIGRLFKKSKQYKKSTVPSSCEVIDSSPNTLTTTSFTVTGSYSESAKKPCDNLSPLKVEEARRLSLTDSLSSGESMSLPTSPGYESGYISSEGPSVSCGISISIIHCSDLEGESFQNGVLKLFNHFSKTLGYKCHLDKLEMLKIAENKFRYAVKRVQHSDFLFICVSPELKRIFDSSVDEISEQLEDDGSCMLRLVSDLILNDLANHGSNRKGKFMTIILDGSSKRDVPCFLDSFMKFQWPKDERKIRCIIEGQPEILPAPVSDVKTDPPSQVVRPAGII